MPVTGRGGQKDCEVLAIDSKMSVMFLALRTARALHSINIIFLLPHGLVRLEGLGKLKEKLMTSLGLKPRPSGLQHSASITILPHLVT
jgi:hypothetical protein